MFGEHPSVSPIFLFRMGIAHSEQDIHCLILNSINVGGGKGQLFSLVLFYFSFYTQGCFLRVLKCGSQGLPYVELRGPLIRFRGLLF